MKRLNLENLNTTENMDEFWKGTLLRQQNCNRNLYVYEISDLKNIKDNCSVLEIGCGDGYYLKYINDHFNNVKTFGVDISNEAIKYAKLHYNLNCSVINPFEDFTEEKFDIVVMHQVIEHFEDPERIIDYSMKFLKNDGQLTISSVTDNFSYERFHIFCFEENDFSAILKARFEKVNIKLLDVANRPQSIILGVANIKRSTK